MLPNTPKSTFALFFGNRGFFPASLIAGAREDLVSTLRALGHDTLLCPDDATRFGGVETVEEGRVYANFLAQNRGRYDGVILSLPNFGDENGALTALRDANVPILIQAYPDELDKMSPAERRDAFCGKFSIMDMFNQAELPFTVLKPHVVHPTAEAFKDNVAYFDTVCRVVKGLRRFVVGSIGARTTPFKTVRIDEVALQRHGITVETIDLASVIARTKAVEKGSEAFEAKARKLRGLTRWGKSPEWAFDNIARLGVVLDELIEENGFNALALRCWIELQEELGVSPCTLMGELNDRLIASACEVDLGSAVAMHALSLASREPSACLDWNNNYGDAEDKCILFHCGPVPPTMMTGPGEVVDHSILAASIGPDRSYGPNVGRIRPMPFTFANMLTRDGELEFYLGHGRITGEPIAQDFFGCAGVAEIENMEDVFLFVGRQGHRHHVNITEGHHVPAMCEALERYLGYDVALPQEEDVYVAQ